MRVLVIVGLSLATSASLYWFLMTAVDLTRPTSPVVGDA